MLRFLAGCVEPRPDRVREVRGRLQEQRGFADAGLAAEQHERTGHDAAAEHAIELVDPRRQPRRVRRLDVRVQLRGACGAKL